MTETLTISASNCISCVNKGVTPRYLDNNKIVYGPNLKFRIIDSFDTNAKLFGATTFFGFSISEYGSLVYKLAGRKIDQQKIEFPNEDQVYLTFKNGKYVLGL
jgi:hypothetical protein